MDNILELAYRANINVYNYDEKYVIVYDDHRYLLNILHFLRYKNQVKTSLNVIYFDYHDDARKPSSAAIEMTKQFRVNLPSQPDFFRFTEFDLCTLDNDWLLAGMQLSFINDALLIGAKETSMSSQLNGSYIDHVGDAHAFYSIPHLWDCLDSKGCLGDSSIDTESEKIRSIFGFNLPGKPGWSNEKPEYPYILDFDCDVFSMDILGKTTAWPYWRMEELFTKPFAHFNLSSQEFVHNLIERAEIVTICRESGCCGGILQAAQIFNNMDRLFFNSSLSQ
ncbi:hypothetical protein HDF24_07410 [Mucilaginibacter sp. X4EP1]|uniref:hypothetical protein n=1 Tax=Mucilaginibacter sp. X4EP1 TaxID=2723092 RepID=UPI00216A25DC|nr:hypothetical protein [Mucilaginibacter sp. X4EP1]MCS3814139.1 hypothetical protein [Mucilaginibacter sp. X4EP1]